MPPINPTRRRIAFAVAGATSALMLTACAAMSGGSGPDNVPDEVSTTITDDPVELTVAYTDDPPSTALLEGFTEMYPNVTFDLQETPFTDYINTITLTMTSDDPPDIAQYNPGAMRSLVSGGHLLNLDSHAEAYGWDESFPPESLETLMLDEDATRYGTGSIYAAPGAMSVLGVFYNPEILADAGVDEPPTTLAEFETALEEVDEAGHNGFSVGGLEVGGIHLWNALLNVLGDPDDYRDWNFGAPNSTIATDGTEEATEIFVDWVEQGYIPEAANATSDSDAQADFVAGESAFLVTGNWAAFVIEEEAEGDVGFFLMPGHEGTEEPVASGSSVAYSVSAQTEHPDVAAAFLDYLSSPEAAQIQLGTGFMPVDAEAPTESTGLLEQVNTGYTDVVAGAGIVPFPDFATPGMLDELTPGIQGLIAGSMDGDEYLEALQAEWSEHHE